MTWSGESHAGPFSIAATVAVGLHQLLDQVDRPMFEGGVSIVIAELDYTMSWTTLSSPVLL